MKEENIRPNHLVTKSLKFYNQDTRLFLKNKNRFIRIPCPACESYNHQIIFKKNGFTFVRCRKCETVFINPRPTFEMLKEFYTVSKSIKYWKDKIYPASENARRNQIFVPRAKRIFELCKKYNISTKALLDVGAGFGTFCEEIKKMALFDRIIAVEPAHSLAEACRHKGLDVIEKPIEEINNLNNKVNVITNFELIEHLYWPKDFLLNCAKMLSRKGVLILTTPNIKGFDLLILGKLSNNISGPNHLNYFHPESLNYLLQQCGFKTIEIQTPGKLDAELVRKKILSNELDISNNPFLKQVLIEQWENAGNSFQCFLAENLFSSHLWIVAQKV